MWTITLAGSVIREDGSAQTRNIQTTIEEPIPGGVADLDQWEETVRQVGFRSMRQLADTSLLETAGCRFNRHLIR